MNTSEGSQMKLGFYTKMTLKVESHVLENEEKGGPHLPGA